MEVPGALDRLAELPAGLYKDLLHPSCARIGVLAGRAVGVALSPLNALVYGGEQLAELVGDALKTKLHGVPPERIGTPSAVVAGPTLEALRFAGSVPELREMYTSLLARALDRATARLAHPAFVSIIQSLSPDEARILAWWSHEESALAVVEVRARDNTGVGGYEVALPPYSSVARMAGCAHVDLACSYLNNLVRLGLAEMPESIGVHDVDDEMAQLLDDPVVAEARNRVESMPARRLEYDERCIRLTSFGQQFLQACVMNPGHAGAQL